MRERRPDPEVGRPEVSRRDGDGLDGARVEGEAVEDDERHRDELDGGGGGGERGRHVPEDGVAERKKSSSVTLLHPKLIRTVTPSGYCKILSL